MAFELEGDFDFDFRQAGSYIGAVTCIEIQLEIFQFRKIQTIRFMAFLL